MMRKLVVMVAIAATALATPALASSDARFLGAEVGTKLTPLGLTTSNFMPTVENKGDGRRVASPGDSLVDALLDGDLDLSELLPDVENQGGHLPPKPQEPSAEG